jgi:uncharacterized membrane protein
MTLLIAGLALFLGIHSVRIFADGWRTAMVARLSPNGWKGVYSLVSIAGLALIVIGFGAARQQPVLVWVPPIWTRHLASLLVLVSLVMLMAAYVPGNHVKAALKHPMILGVKVWAFAHLVSNQMLAEFLLFGAFFAWAVLDFRAAKARDRAGNVTYPPGRLVPTIITVAAGCGLWAFIAFWAHGAWFGVKPFGGG